MDPLIKLCSSVVTDASVVQLPYYQVDELEFSVQPLDLSRYRIVEDTEVNESNDTYNVNLIRDLVDNINLPKTKNRAENKLLNMITICKWLVEPPSDRVLEGYTLRELYSSSNSQSLRVYDCAAGPGSWSSWILSHYPNSEVVGFTIKGADSNFHWYPELLANPRFHGYYGDLLTEWKTNTELVKNTHFTADHGGSGADLFMSDGGLRFENLVSDQIYIGSIEQQKILIAGRMKLILAQILAALNVTAINGSIIIKLFDIDHPVLHQLLTVLGMCCKYSTIVKLITSRSQNREMFYIGLYRKPRVEAEILVLSDILNRWEELYPMTIVKQIPRSVQQFFELVINEESDNHTQAVEMGDRLSELLRIGDSRSGERLKKSELIHQDLSKYQLYPDMNRYILYSVLGLMLNYIH